MDNFEILNTAGLTLVQLDFLNYLINSFPSEVKSIGGKDNDPLKPLLVSIAKSLGNSRELILNLKNSKDIVSLIQDIENEKIKHLKINNFKLLLLLLRELNIPVDFNRANDLDYIEEISSKLKILEDSYILKKSRGSNNSIYTLLEDLSYMDSTIDVSKVMIIESLEDINSKVPANETSLKSGLQQAFESKGSPLIYLGVVNQDYLDPDADESFSNLLPLKTTAEIHKELMLIKPAGIRYNLYASSESNQTITITYDSNGGNSPSFRSKKAFVGSKYGNFPTVSKEFYRLSGWSTAKTEGDSVNSSTEISTESDHTLYAQWVYALNWDIYQILQGTDFDSYVSIVNPTFALEAKLGYTIDGTGESYNTAISYAISLVENFYKGDIPPIGTLVHIYAFDTVISDYAHFILRFNLNT